MGASGRARRGFDAGALYDALDDARRARGLSWAAVTTEIWEQSAELNARRPGDHPIATSTITGMAARRATSCQHALFMLRWLGRPPEDFVPGGSVVPARPLPAAGPDRRLRWDLTALAEAIDARRHAEALTWQQLATTLGCTANQLTGLRRVRFAVGMGLSMSGVQWLGRPAADFVRASRW